MAQVVTTTEKLFAFRSTAAVTAFTTTESPASDITAARTVEKLFAFRSPGGTLTSSTAATEYSTPAAATISTVATAEKLFAFRTTTATLTTTRSAFSTALPISLAEKYSYEPASVPKFAEVVSLNGTRAPILSRITLPRKLKNKAPRVFSSATNLQGKKEPVLPKGQSSSESVGADLIAISEAGNTDTATPGSTPLDSATPETGRSSARDRPSVLQRIKSKPSILIEKKAGSKEVRILPEVRPRSRVTSPSSTPSTAETTSTTTSPDATTDVDQKLSSTAPDEFLSTVAPAVFTHISEVLSTASPEETTSTYRYSSAEDDLVVEAQAVSQATGSGHSQSQPGRKRKVILNYFPSKTPAKLAETAQPITEGQSSDSATVTTDTFPVTLQASVSEHTDSHGAAFAPGASRASLELSLPPAGEIQDTAVNTDNHLVSPTDDTPVTAAAETETTTTATGATVTTTQETLATVTATTATLATSTAPPEAKRPKIFFDRNQLKEKLKGVVLSVIEDPQTATLEQKVGISSFHFFFILV